jgi:phage FluMu gp28-like protein
MRRTLHQVQTSSHGTVTIRLPALHSAQQQVVAEAARFSVLACGRRWGKSTLGINRLVLAALHGAPVGWCSPTYKMLAEIWRSVRTIVQPVLGRVQSQQYRLELLTGGLIEMWSLEQPDAIRGRKYARVVIDEAAMVRDLAQVWQLVIRPTLADLRGDAWLLSTPRGRTFFWECFQRGQQDDAWQSWQLPTSSNPHIDAAEIAAAQRELPEQVFQQEFLAQFLDAAGGVFRRVHERATATPQSDAQPGHSYVLGVDFARQHDYTVLAVLDTTTRELVALERFNQLDYSLQLGRLEALAARFRPDVILAEQNSIGLPLIEQLQQRGDLPVQPFVTSQASKARIIDALALALEQGTLHLLADPVLLDELQAFELERLPSGLLRYGAPPGGHDDTVIALALAHWAAREQGPLVLW